MFCLTSCGEKTEPAQQTQMSEQPLDPRCQQIMVLYSISDWQSFASGPFVEVENNSTVQARRAPARNLLSESYACDIAARKSRYSYILFTAEVQSFDYQCNAPMTEADGDDPLAAVKAFAAPWKSCFAGWNERVSLYRSPDQLATVVYIRDEHLVSFTSSIIGRNYTISISKDDAKWPRR